MKRFLSVLMIAAMLASIFAVSAMADDAPVLIFTENFTNPDTFTDRFAWGAYYIEDNKLIGYSEARALQQVQYMQVKYDMEMTVAIGEDEMYTGDDRSFFMGYPNTNLEYEGRAEGTVWMVFHYSVTNKEFTFFVGGFGPDEENAIHFADPIPMEIEADKGEEFYKMGMSIDRGRIRCFFEGEMLFEYVDTADEYLIGYATEEPYFVWNTGNCMIYDELKLGQVGSIYPYPVEEETTVTTEAPATEDTTASTDAPVDNTDAPVDNTDAPVDSTEGDVTSVPADETNAPADNDTDVPEADTVGTTGTQTPSTSTGDATFVVVMAMVAAIGSALIVKRVRG